MPSHFALQRVNRTSSKLSFLELFVREEDYEDWATQTNIYAQQSLMKKGPLAPRSRFYHWVDTTGEEMKLFFALIYLFGVHKLRDLTTYWSKHPVWHHPWVAQVMTRDRFQLLRTFFHLADNELFVPDAKAKAVRPTDKLGTFYKRTQERFKRNFILGRNRSIDEGTIPWKGNLRFKVYNPNKPVKYGIKM